MAKRARETEIELPSAKNRKSIKNNSKSCKSYEEQLLNEIKIRLMRQSHQFIWTHGESILLLLSCIQKVELYSSIVALYDFLVPFFDPAEPCVVLASKHLQIYHPPQPLHNYDDIDQLLTVANIKNGAATNGLIAQGLAFAAHETNSQRILLLKAQRMISNMEYHLRIGKDRLVTKESQHSIYFMTHMILLGTMYGMQPSCVSFRGWEKNVKNALDLIAPYKEENLELFLELHWCLSLLEKQQAETASDLTSELTLPSCLPHIHNTPTFIHCALLWLLAKESEQMKGK